MNYTLNGIPHFDFFSALENYFEEIINLLNTENNNIVEFKEEVERLITQTKKWLTDYLEPPSKAILYLLNSSYPSSFDNIYSFFATDKDPAIQKEIERLDRFRMSLRLTIGYLSMIDSLSNPETSISIETISEKNDFILSKLNSVFGDEMYSIERILEFNNVRFREKEAREIAEDLSRRGYLILNERYGDCDYVKISVKGAKYIERKLKQKTLTKEKSQLDKKIDAIIEHLIKLGYGQEIIFNEIDELRSLQHKLSKKSWAQLLKGKLMDLALDKLLSVDAAKSVYEYLTSNNFKLLK